VSSTSRKSFTAILSGFFLILAGLIYWQVIADLSDHPLNPRRYDVFRQPRGAILDRWGTPLACTVRQNGDYVRVYACPSLSHVTGYFHQRYGMTGLERTYNSSLAQGQEVHTTIDLALQQKLEALMEGRVGAAIAMNPKTGEVLALLSSPYVDPNKLDEFWSDYAADPRSPFVNRATRGQYPPGSAVKPFVLAAALADRITFPEERWQDSGRVVLSGRTISNFQSQGWGSLTSLEALANSSNVVFAQLAAKLGPRLLDTLRQCGLGEALPFPLGSAAGKLPPAEQSAYGWGQIGIGQGSLLVTPLQMAAAVSAIANGGQLMRPYLVEEVRGGWRLPRLQRPVVYSQAVPQWTAAAVREGMVLAVQQGTAKGAALPGVIAAGKTGTAETLTGDDHAWFIGFAPAHDPRIAVAVVLEHGGLASETAAPLGGLVMQAALEACTQGGMQIER
jgi:peptidoglycan glycosyltransferase